MLAPRQTPARISGLKRSRLLINRSRNDGAALGQSACVPFNCAFLGSARRQFTQSDFRHFLVTAKFAMRVEAASRMADLTACII
jgi:hypothetical protein